MKCIKCDGEMEKGIIVPKPAFGWFKSTNLKLVWGSKLKMSMLTGVTYENEQLVHTYKCKKCGYLESYAV